MEYFFIATTVLLVAYALLTLLFIRTRLNVGIGVGLTSLLMVASSVYVLITGKHEVSIILFIASIILPTLLASKIIGVSFLRGLISAYMSIIRIGISQERLDAGREEFSAEMKQKITDGFEPGKHVSENVAEEILQDADDYSKEEYGTIKKIALETGYITDDKIFEVIGRKYTKAAVIRKKLVDEGVISS